MWLFWVVWLPSGQALWHQAFPYSVASGFSLLKFVNYHLIFSFIVRIHQTHLLLFTWLNEWILPLLRGKLQNWDVLSFTHSLPTILYSNSPWHDHTNLAYRIYFSISLVHPRWMASPVRAEIFVRSVSRWTASLENRAWHLEMLIHIHHGKEDAVEWMLRKC